jgi:ribulose bisphosphate carboxylase small subunit
MSTTIIEVEGEIVRAHLCANTRIYNIKVTDEQLEQLLAKHTNGIASADVEDIREEIEIIQEMCKNLHANSDRAALLTIEDCLDDLLKMLPEKK